MIRLALRCGAGFAVMVMFAGAVSAQQADRSIPVDLFRQLSGLDMGRLAILLIFGTGFIAAAFQGLGWVIRSLRQDVPQGERLREEIAALEARVATLEQQVSGSALSDTSTTAAR